MYLLVQVYISFTGIIYFFFHFHIFYKSTIWYFLDTPLLISIPFSLPLKMVRYIIFQRQEFYKIGMKEFFRFHFSVFIFFELIWFNLKLHIKQKIHSLLREWIFILRKVLLLKQSTLYNSLNVSKTIIANFASFCVCLFKSILNIC